MSKDEAIKWKNKEKEFLAEIKSLQKKNDEINRSVRTKDQQIDKLKGIESKHTNEIEALKVKLKKTNLKDVSKLNSSRAPSVDNIAKHFKPIPSSNGTDSDCESLPPQPKPKPIDKKQFFVRNQLDLPANCVMAYRTEKWIGINGGTVKMPMANLVIPSHCFNSKTLVTATKIEVSKDLITKIEETHLQDVVEPLVHMYLEPQGIELEGEVYLDLMGCVNNPRYRYIILYKDSDYYKSNEWEEITNECNPRFMKGSILRMPIPYFANYIILRLDVPVTSFIGNNSNQGYSLGPLNQTNNTAPRAYYGGINTDVMISIINGRYKMIEFHVYHDIRNKNLNVWARAQSRKLTRRASTGNDVTDGSITESSTHMFITKLTSKFPLCCNDRIYFHFDGHKKWQQMGIIDFDEILQPKGQLIKVALSVKKSGPPGAPTVHMEKMPKKVSITRRIADRLDAQEVCEIDMVEAPMSSEHQLASITTAVIDKVLARVRIRIMRTVDVKYIMVIMRKNDIFTPLEQDEVVREKTPYTRAKLFMDYLARKGAKGMMGLCDALEADYVGLAHEIRAILQSNV